MARLKVGYEASPMLDLAIVAGFLCSATCSTSPSGGWSRRTAAPIWQQIGALLLLLVVGYLRWRYDR
jgi:MYXO-CTERM domain-containing protein